MSAIAPDSDTGSAPDSEPQSRDLRASEVLVATLVRLWGSYSQAYRQLSRPGPKGSAVHDLRVAVRRLLAALRLAQACTGIRTRHLRRELRSTMLRLGPVRDAEVHVAKLQGLVGRYSSLRALRRSLAREHALGLSAQHRQMPLAALERQSRELGGLLVRLRAAWQEVDAALPAQVWRLLSKRHRRLSSALQHPSSNDAPALHRMRVALKGLRYTLELATIYFPDVFPDLLLEEARRWQNALGEIQDWDTLTTAARGFALHTPAAVASAAHGVLKLRCRQAIAAVTRRRQRIAAFADRVAIQAANLHRPDEHAPISDAARQGGGAE